MKLTGILKNVAITLNWLFFAIQLVFILICMACIQSRGMGLYAPIAGWFFVKAVITIAVLAALVSSRYQPSLWLAYFAAVSLAVVYNWEWYSYLNLFIALAPPMETVVCGLLGILNLIVLTVTRPLQLRSNLARFTFIGGVIVGGATVASVAIPLISRIESQYSYAMHFKRLGGGVRWKNGNVDDVSLIRTATTNDDLRLLSHFPHLRFVNLTETQISDEGLSHLAGLHSLDTLYLFDTAITDGGLQYLFGLKKLRSLRMQGTQVTDEGLMKIATAIPGLRANNGHLSVGR